MLMVVVITTALRAEIWESLGTGRLKAETKPFPLPRLSPLLQTNNKYSMVALWMTN